MKNEKSKIKNQNLDIKIHGIVEASCLGQRSSKMPDLFFTSHYSLFANKAFTLLELLLVVAVLSIFAGMAIPAFSDAFADFKIESAANRIAADIRYARSYAIKTSDTISVNFNISDENYEIKNNDNNRIKHPFSKKDFLITMTKEFDLEKIDLYTVTIPGGGSTVNFNSLGATPGGVVKIRYAGREKTITVNQADGEASVS